MGGVKDKTGVLFISSQLLIRTVEELTYSQTIVSLQTLSELKA